MKSIGKSINGKTLSRLVKDGVYDKTAPLGHTGNLFYGYKNNFNRLIDVFNTEGNVILEDVEKVSPVSSIDKCEIRIPGYSFFSKEGKVGLIGLNENTQNVFDYEIDGNLL